MGLASKVTSVFLRLMELISAAVVAGLVGGYLHYVGNGYGADNSRIVYTVAIAGISLFFALICLPPFKYSFFFFILDFALFICWMVAFGLLVDLTGSNACTSSWYWQNWGYYWGGFYRYYPYLGAPQSIVGTSSCGKWRATLAWSFIGGWFWLVSGFLGVYVCYRNRYDKTEIMEKEQNHVNGPSNNILGTGAVDNITPQEPTTRV